MRTLERVQWFVLLAAALMLATRSSATCPGQNGRIAFIQNTGLNGSDVFSMNPDGIDVVQLTQIGRSNCVRARCPRFQSFRHLRDRAGRQRSGHGV